MPDHAWPVDEYGRPRGGFPRTPLQHAPQPIDFSVARLGAKGLRERLEDVEKLGFMTEFFSFVMPRSVLSRRSGGTLLMMSNKCATSPSSTIGQRALAGTKAA